ncbi:hypothetical protein TNCV_5106101 [Trichonephila clavipes]|nr:hypothetical protein TNCV_5106101 [Trichonephila clavipes]
MFFVVVVSWPPDLDCLKSRPTILIMARSHVRLYLVLALSTIQVIVRFCSVPSRDLEGEPAGGGQEPPTCLPHLPT